MQRGLAIRHLLLRHLWSVKASADPTLHAEIARTLAISSENDEYVVRWTARGAPIERRYSTAAFSLYIRGDGANSPGATGDDDANESLGREFAQSALAISSRTDAPRKQRLRRSDWLSLAGAVVFSTAMALADIPTSPTRGALIFALFALEFVPGPYGKATVGLLFGALSLIRLPATGLIGALAYALFQFLDPNIEGRGLRTSCAALAAIASAMALVSSGSAMRFGWLTLATVIVAIGLCIARWLCGTHFRSTPLIVPLLSVGLQLDGYASLAMVALVAAAISALAARFGYRLRGPVRSERPSPPTPLVALSTRGGSGSGAQSP